MFDKRVLFCFGPIVVDQHIEEWFVVVHENATGFSKLVDSKHLNHKGVLFDRGVELLLFLLFSVVGLKLVENVEIE
jgi:hypothetical protein